MSERRNELAENLATVQAEISPYSPTLIVVTKTYPVSDLEILLDLGVRDFGENRSDEGARKSEAISSQARDSQLIWHYQGAIQSKKLGEILSWADCIHSLDDATHAAKIGRLLGERRESGSLGKLNLFLQLSLDGNPDRGGLVEGELFELAQIAAQIGEINILGIMSVPPPEMDPILAFSKISTVHQRFKSEYPDSKYLSAGMSGDYLVALEHGATHIRVGSKILGSRRYDQ